jgi:hypothetical protein
LSPLHFAKFRRLRLCSPTRMHLGRTMYGQEGHVCSGGRYFEAMPGIRGYRTFKYRMAINTVGVQAVHRCIGRSLSKRSQALQRLLIPAVTWSLSECISPPLLCSSSSPPCAPLCPTCALLRHCLAHLMGAVRLLRAAVYVVQPGSMKFDLHTHKPFHNAGKETRHVLRLLLAF